MQNPFTLTFSKVPEYTYIPTEQTDEILSGLASEHVFRITGVRGSGKTVMLARIEQVLRSEEKREEGWLVFDLNPTRDMLLQTASMLEAEGFGNPEMRDSSVSGISDAVGMMLGEAKAKGKRILFAVDEVSKTEEMTDFLSEFGKWMEESYPVYLVCTGLYENLAEVNNVKALSFFRKASTVITGPLNMVRMAEMYRLRLNVDIADARSMAALTKGYAYAFQILGVMYFKRKEDETLDDVISSFKSELYAGSYEKIWDDLTDGDRFLVRILAQKDEYKREEILPLMGVRKGNYSMYRDRLLKRGLVRARQGYISLSLPFFADYIHEYSL